MNHLDLFRRPFAGFSDLESWINSISSVPNDLRKGFSAKCEISETPQSYLFKFELPGLKKEEIKVDLHDNRLTVSGERKEERTEQKDKKTHYSEMTYGNFMRSYTLPTPVDAEKVEARYEEGILSVEVQKASTSRPRQISVR